MIFSDCLVADQRISQLFTDSSSFLRFLNVLMYHMPIENTIMVCGLLPLFFFTLMCLIVPKISMG